MHEEYIRDVRESDTVYLFIHGILSTPNHFRRFIPYVPKNVAVHNILLDGHGKTVGDFANSSMKKWEDCVDRKMQQLTKKYKNIIIIAHSMGTLFAINASIKYKSYVKKMFLLAIPLRIFLKPSALINGLKVVYDRVKDDDKIALAAKETYSITLNKNLFSYASWIPRYLELFAKSKEVRGKIDDVRVDTQVFQSQKDEMVSSLSMKHLMGNDFVKVDILKNSRHFYYDESDFNYVIKTIFEEN